MSYGEDAGEIRRDRALGDAPKGSRPRRDRFGHCAAYFRSMQELLSPKCQRH
ncbi:hypothetical protein [Brasilonema bromeliae]|uniref:hypothetical protein n=1 Tax=Brasilonema bromeliae TaxID=383615 RepID=UPI00145CCBC3|nr:hypothetical protein [Brasilonema bromeliae]